MRSVGLKILKNKLSEYVRAAAAGETIVVTDRGRPVAELVPPHSDLCLSGGRPLSVFELRGMREGWLRPATIRDGSPPPKKPVEGLTFEQLMADLERDREDRR
jgi:prevent-host-death family protein